MIQFLVHPCFSKVPGNNEDNTIRSLTRWTGSSSQSTNPSGTIKKFSKNLNTKRYKKRLVRYGLLAGNIAVVGIAAAFVLHNPNSKAINRSEAEISNTQAVNPLDTLSAADIAVNAARMANLAETTSVTNQADSVAAELNTHVVDYAVVPKPQIMSSVVKTKADIKDYKVVDGDTLASLASKFGVTSESIKWSNSMTTNTIKPGTSLVIPPIDGVAYTVKSGDTADTLASKYRASRDQIIVFNDAEVSGLKVGDRIMIPGGSVPAPVVTYTAVSYSFIPAYGGNGYDYGWCTYYVASRIDIPRNWGNANTWDNNAAASGWIVSTTPRVGAIGQTDRNGLGHVGIVEAVSEDGSMIKYSDMNGINGWGKVGYSDWVPTYSRFQRFIYR